MQKQIKELDISELYNDKRIQYYRGFNAGLKKQSKNRIQENLITVLWKSLGYVDLIPH